MSQKRRPQQGHASRNNSAKGPARNHRRGDRPKPAAQPVSDPGGPIRINKALASAGVCSRRGADDLIAAGRVSLNGETVQAPGVKVDPSRDRLEVDGERVSLPSPAVDEHVYLIMNKPVQTVTTAHDPQGRPTVMDMLPGNLPRRVFPVGRLDFFSQGLLLLTSDGDLAHRLTHPSHHLPKVYEVRVRGKVTSSMLKTMEKGMTLAEGERLAPVKASAKPLKDGCTLLQMTLIQGINRQIRRMCRDFGLTILHLIRIRQGPVELGDLAPGTVKYLEKRQVDALKRAAGLR